MKNANVLIDCAHRCGCAIIPCRRQGYAAEWGIRIGGRAGAAHPHIDPCGFQDLGIWRRGLAHRAMLRWRSRLGKHILRCVGAPTTKSCGYFRIRVWLDQMSGLLYKGSHEHRHKHLYLAEWSRDRSRRQWQCLFRAQAPGYNRQASTMGDVRRCCRSDLGAAGMALLVALHHRHGPAGRASCVAEAACCERNRNCRALSSGRARAAKCWRL